jgi:nucleotide-binding universal stress UspA family protein
MKILIALDSSLHSERALNFVARMRWPAGSRVIVLSVLQPAAAGAVTGPYDSTPVAAESLEALRHQLEEVVARAEHSLSEVGFSTEGRVLTGDPRQTLIEIAHSERADLIVVGSHGRTGLMKMMLGSVSSHVVTHAPCSVLVVKQNGRAAAGGKPARA